MAVPNYEYNFDGTDVTTDTNIAAGGVQSGTLTENGVTFSFSSNATNANFSSTYALSVSSGTATLTINDIPSEEFFSNLVIDFGTSPASAFFGNNSIVLRRTKTDNGAAGSTSTVTITNGQITSNAIVTAPPGKWNSIQFKSTGFMIIEDITADVNCFLTGTMIATDKGETAVEALQPGDLVRTADGRTSAVTWVAKQDINTTFTHPAKVNPVCIRAGALGDGLPMRDLYVTGDHGIEIGGTLYTAASLTNGSSIFRVAQMPREGFTYYHVETEAHELLLAEGVAAESFIDYAARDGFDNAAEAPRATVAEMALPRVSSPRLVPDELKAELAARADRLERKAA